MTINDLVFEYFIGNESEQFTFIKVPKIFFTEKYFTELSFGAKILYGLLLDRMSLSRKNGWMDNEKRIYVIYTIESIQKDFHVSKTIAIRFIKELEEFGLIEKKKRPNAAALIYVKNFIAWKSKGHENQLIKGSPETGSPEIQNMEVQKMDFQKGTEESGSPYSGLPHNRLPEVQNIDSNKTDINKINDSSSLIKKWEALNDDEIKLLIMQQIQITKIPEKEDAELVDQVIDCLKEIFKSRKQNHMIDGNLVSMCLIKEKLWICMNHNNFFDVIKNIKRNGAEQIYNFQNYIITCFYKKINFQTKNTEQSNRKLLFEFENQNNYDFEKLEAELLSNN